MSAYHRTAAGVAYSFEGGMQRAASGIADVLIASHEAHREDAARARIVLAEAARVRASRLARAARREAEDAALDREAAVTVAVLRRRLAARHA